MLIDQEPLRSNLNNEGLLTNPLLLVPFQLILCDETELWVRDSHAGAG
ncbi:MAG: hypothetical protein ACI91T_002538 [Natronomonas sp.]